MPEQCLGCERIDTAPIALANGTTVCNFCPAWKAECLARHKHVEAMRGMSVEGRRGRIAAVERDEGSESAERLRVAFRQDLEARKEMEKQ